MPFQPPGSTCRTLAAAALATMAAIVSTAVAIAHGGSQEGSSGAAQDRSACTRLSALSVPDVAVTSATVIPAKGETPEHCKIRGALEKTILFEVALPTGGWNGKFFFAGGGGYNGTIPDLSQGIARGYVTAGTDTGHQGESNDASWALDNQKAQIDYGYRATHLVTVVAKQILREYYGRKERRAYFVACSNGGKMGLTEIQRYPDDYDGAVTGCPVIDRTNLMMAFIWLGQALGSDSIPKAKLPAIARATLAACDAQDGLKDGVIDSPDQCTFDPQVLTCKGRDGVDCLTPGQVTALAKIYAGPVNSKGERLFPGYPPGHEEDYAAFITGDGDQHRSSTWRLADGFMRYFAFGPNYDSMKEFNFDTSLAALKPFVADQDADKTDLSAFRARGGKLIMYVGWADHSIPPARAVRYYNDVRTQTGDNFIRLFMVPGMHHCTNGPGPWNFGARGQRALRDDAEHDIVRALDMWVEHGTAPTRLIAAKFTNDDPTQGVARTRPLCPYPQVARYAGSGSIDDAASFTCASPH
jgi:tannase/feruloyl esterase